MKGRIQKLIAASGRCSRRKAEELIKDGRVEVNGKSASLGDSADTDKDTITVDGQALTPEEKIYLLLNKPAGYECTLSSTSGKPLVTDLINISQRVFPVGRLDADSRGLILLTNDGDFANALIHPSSAVEKEYSVTVEGHVTDEHVRTLSVGVMVDHKMTRPCQVRVLKRGKSVTLLSVVLHEGRKRQIRRMLEAVGFKVTDIVRERIGRLTLAGLRERSWRNLTAAEVKSLLRHPSKPKKGKSRESHPI